MERGLKNLNIEDGEEAWMIGDIQKSVYEFYIMCCFLTTSVVHFSTMRNIMTNFWHPFEGVQISNLGENGSCPSFSMSIWLQEEEDNGFFEVDSYG
ncbi:hypothetical protein J1N35_011705 [Gossypium stocksii]|uniref:DUF4283 domain-containing protein n=1 Tax=Gossypium stocksii TaxID=47602 RepID=A0A9D4ABP5_9ROSI|nr:hypothetical protein J1N35_011705 [Gossypium stocksii]